jgi:hypothetical protein
MALLLCSMALPLPSVATDLYGPQGVKPQAVRQGKLGSCYFHAVIAALAEFQAQGLQRMIQAHSGGSYTVRYVKNESEEQAGGALERALQAGLPVVACSGGSQYSQQLAEGRALPADTKSWYVNAHCYTALAYDGNGRTVTLRNPWARFPEPDGVFTLPVKTFVPAFRGIITTE